MKITRRYRRGLPSPFLVVFLLLAVTAFCVINWTLLKTVNPVQPEAKSFETMLLEAMLEEMVPVMKAEPQIPLSDAVKFTVSRENKLELEPWMLDLEAFRRSGTDSEPALEDWMIDTSSWHAE
jgi:hypothetical protein